MAKRERTEEHGVVFSGPQNTSVGWAIPVPEAFRDALDIQLSPRKGGAVWTQGVPPQYQFAGGALLYDPPEARGMVWGEAVRLLRRTIQITSAVPDALDGEEIQSGSVAYRLDHYENSKVVTSEQAEVTQRGFVELLRSGVVPDDERIVEIPIPPHGGQSRRWGFEYHDADGQVTYRTVRVRTIKSREGVYYISGVCEAAQTPRTFRADRILELFDNETGEIVEYVVPWIAAQATPAVPASPRPWRRPVDPDDPKLPAKIKEAVKRGLRVLLALAVADGTATDEERALLAVYVEQRMTMIGMPPVGSAKAMVDEFTRLMRPSLPVAVKALNKQAGIDGLSWPDHHALLMVIATRLVLVGGHADGVDALLAALAGALEPANEVHVG